MARTLPIQQRSSDAARGRSVGVSGREERVKIGERRKFTVTSCPVTFPLYHWATLENPWCRRRDLNPHAPKSTSPSSWRVCLFRHSDANFYFSLSETGLVFNCPRASAKSSAN